MLNRVFPGRSAGWVSRAAAAGFALALVLDSTGNLLHRSAVWRLGGHVWVIALLLGSAAWLALILERRAGGSRRGVALVLSAVVLATVARWLRGSAGVPPDSPLLAVEVISAVLMLAGMRRSRRARRNWGLTDGADRRPLTLLNAAAATLAMAF